MKTIIQVWTHHCYNMPQTGDSNYWGLGDVLRGTIQLYILSKKMGFKLYVDTSLHPVSKYLEPSENPFSAFIQGNKDKIRMVPANEDLEAQINRLSEDISFFFTNAHINGEIDDDCKRFIKNILRPNDTLRKEIKKTVKSDSYNIMHFRLGDDELVHNIKNIPAYTQNKVLNLIKANKSINDILMSDSLSLKMNREVLNEINVIETIPVHLGRSTDHNSIKDTLIDFFILTTASKIKTYTSYEWISGFVYWAHKIYDIPLMKME